ncbi:hypothetical protein D3C73_758240 [compost metagenome]
MAGFVGGGRSLLGLFAQLLDCRQVALAHAVDKPLERQISDAHQPEVTVFTVKQAPGDRLIEVLEPMHTDNRRLAQCLLEEVGVRRTAVFLLHQRRNAAPERATISRAEIELGDQHRFVETAQPGEVVTILGLQGVHVEAQHVAILGAGLHCLRRADGETAAEQ